jgi:hypothetical protein
MKKKLTNSNIIRAFVMDVQIHEGGVQAVTFIIQGTSSSVGYSFNVVSCK